MTKALVLDTTYLLPFFGIAVKGVDEHRVASLRKKFELIYPVLMLPELWAKVMREVERRKLKEVPDQVLDALQALLGEIDVKLATPCLDQLTIAAKLRLIGHKDIFDCLGYGCAVAIDGKFLSEDKKLRKFLEGLDEEGLDPERIVSLSEIG